MRTVEKFLLLYFIINSLKIISSWSIEKLATNDILINTQKSYFLKRIGTYSPKIEEKIVHTFIPIVNPCLQLPETSVCYYISRSKSINIIELVTIMISGQPVQITSYFDRDSISRLIRNDISQVLAQHNPARIINNTNSIIHFINDKTYYQTNNEKELIPAHRNNAISVDPGIPYLDPTPAEKIMKQMNNNKINYDFLSDIDLKLFLNAVFSYIDRSYIISDIQETLNAFNKLIIGQSVFALRSCSLSSIKSMHSQPCLAISTLFAGTPADSITTFTIFRLNSLPIVFDGDLYVYSNLPKIIGINLLDQTFIIFDDGLDTSECIFSSIVLCRFKYISVASSRSSCLSQLFDENQQVANLCSVSRSRNIQNEMINVNDEIYLFYNIHQPYHCQIYSTSNKLIGTISVNEAVLFRIPCNNTIICAHIQLSASSCKDIRVIVTPISTLSGLNLPHFIIPLNNSERTLVSLYQSQTGKFMNDLTEAFISKQPRFKETVRDAATYILSIICFIFTILFIYIFKIIKYKLQREMRNLEEIVEDAIDF